MNDQESAEPQEPPRRRWGPTVRSTILVAVLALSALALATSGYTAMVLQDLRVQTRIDNDLQASAEEFRLLAAEGVDPETGERFSSPAILVRTAMARTIPARNEGVVGIVDGRIQYTSSGAPVALEEDPQLVEALGPLLLGERGAFATITTQTTTYRVAAVPVFGSVGTTEMSTTTPTPVPTLTPDDNPTQAGITPDLSNTAGVVYGYDLGAELSEFRQVFVIYTAVAAASVAVVGVVGWLVAGRLLRPVRVLASTARRVGREDLSERIPVTGNDDLADMTRATNEMLERLDEAFATQRNLVGDVSHELRTPLTVVRGHLELMDPDDGVDAREVRDLVLDEVSRMNRVVDDLTTLASVEQPDFLHREDMEIGALTDEVFDKAVALGDREWAMGTRAEATSFGDRQRLTQAWLQLVSNAVKFSAQGSRMELGSAVHDGIASLWVKDQGVGIAPEDQDRIFERFQRAGDRSKQGSGLGLAIVSAIADAHDGEVACESELGVGSIFTIMVPGVRAHEEE